MKLNHYFAMLVAAVGAMACQPSDAEFTPKLEVKGNSLTENTLPVAAKGTTTHLNINSNVSYSVTSDKDWVTADPINVENPDKKDLKSTVTLTVNPNTGEEERTATVKVSSADYPAVDYTFTVNQSGMVTEKSLEVLVNGTPVTGDLEVSASDKTLSVMTVSTVSWKAESDQPWLKVSPASATVKDYVKTPTTVTFSFSENTSSTTSREATVTFTGEEGVAPVAVTVKQAAKKVYTFNINVSEIGAYTAVISCAPSDETVNYLLSYASASNVNQMGGIEAYAKAELEYVAQQYEGFDMGQVLSVVFAPGAREMGAVELDENAEHYAYAVAVDAELNMISDVKAEKFNTIEFNPGEDYLKWLGTWTMGAEGTFYNVTITPYSETLYTVDGYEGGGQNKYPPFLAGFNEETKGLVFFGNENLAAVTVTDQTGAQVPCYLGFFATGDDEYVYPGEYLIAEASLSDESNATVNGYTLTDEESGTEVTMVSMQYWAVPMEGNSVYRFSQAPLFPLTMTKTGELPSETNATFAADKVVSIEKTTKQLMKAVSTEKAAVRKFAGVNTLKLR